MSLLTPEQIEIAFPRFWPDRPGDRCCLSADELGVFARAIEAATAAKLNERIAELTSLLQKVMHDPEVCNGTLTGTPPKYTPDCVSLRAKLDAAAVDAERLDWLDSLNAALNKRNGTTYGWKLILSPMIVRLMAGQHKAGFVGDLDLNDANTNGAASCRAAIDAMRTGEPKA